MTDSPHNLEAERALLGAMLTRSGSIADATRLLNGDEFHSPKHAAIYNALVTLHTAGGACDPITVADHLARTESVLDIPIVELTALIVEAPSTAAERYAVIIRDQAKLRRLLVAAGEIRELATSAPEDPQQVVDRAEQIIFNVADRARTSRQAVKLGDGLFTWSESLDGRAAGPAGVPCGWLDLDNKLGGLRPGQLVVVAGRPGMGKSAFLGNLAVNAASIGHPALMISAEMALEELQDRFVASDAKVDLHRIRTGRVAGDDWKRLSDAVGRLSDLHVWLQEAPGATLLSIRSEARRVAAKSGSLGVLIVDYIQLLKPVGKFENRQNEVAYLARGLKELALELHVPVVAAAQLNRSLEIRANKRPLLSDLRESGELENAADVVLFLYRDDYYNPNSKDAGTCEIDVAKHRNGPTGVVMLTWLASYGRLLNQTKAVG